MNPDSLSRESYCCWHKPIDRRCEELKLRITESFVGLGPDMIHRWILDLELMLEWNGDLLLWGYNTWNLHGPDSFKVFCINKRYEQILKIRRRHQTFVVKSD